VQKYIWPLGLVYTNIYHEHPSHRTTKILITIKIRPAFAHARNGSKLIFKKGKMEMMSLHNQPVKKNSRAKQNRSEKTDLLAI
jgi:hypothetical protein